MKDINEYIIKENAVPPTPPSEEMDVVSERLLANRTALLKSYLQGYDAVNESLKDIINNFSNVLNFKDNPTLLKSNYLNNLSPAFVKFSKSMKVLHNQSTSIFDKITVHLGLFDEDIKELNVKKSELLKKVNVKNFNIEPTAFHPNFSVTSKEGQLNSCYNFINEGMAYYINCILNYSKDPKDAVKSFKAEYENQLVPYLAKYFDKPGNSTKYYKKLLFGSLGDGSKVKYIKINFQKDYFKVQVRIDIINKFLSKQGVKDSMDVLKASLDDANVRFERCMKDVLKVAKDKEQIAAINAIAKQTLIEYKVIDSFFIQTEMAFLDMMTYLKIDSIKICKDLLKYNGD